jgi:nucleotide-binding universal stress UspA family protein
MPTIEKERAVELKNILLATDFSEVSQKALPHAAAIASRYGSNIELLHVLPLEPRKPIPIEPLPPELDRDAWDAELAMKRFAADHALDEIRCKTRIERGRIEDVVGELIRRDEIDLLVLGTHGRSGLKKVILGSVAEEVFRIASCPVLTVGPAVPARTPEAGLHRILFATDFGPSSLDALPYAISLATENHAKLILLHVVPPPPAVDVGPYWYVGADLVDQQKAAGAKSLTRLKSLIPSDIKLPFEPVFLVEFDVAYEAILTTADNWQAELIVMGVNQTKSARVSAHLPWVIAHEVVCRAKCPVLTVRS